MSRSVSASGALVLLLSGCAATSTMVGSSAPDPAQIKPGDPRSKVEKTLDAPAWSAGSDDELRYDIYEYEPARKANLGLGAKRLIADVLTSGTEEIIYSGEKETRAVTQLVIAYDKQDRVRFVSRLWSAEGPKACRRMRSRLPADSGVPSTARPAAMPGQTGSVSKTATLSWAWLNRGFVKTIDGRKPESRRVELPPGPHNVELADGNANVEFLPGRLYRVETDSFQAAHGTEVVITFIADTNSGETLECLTRSQGTEF